MLVLENSIASLFQLHVDMSIALAVGVQVTVFCFEIGKVVEEKDVLTILGTLTLAFFTEAENY